MGYSEARPSRGQKRYTPDDVDADSFRGNELLWVDHLITINRFHVRYVVDGMHTTTSVSEQDLLKAGFLPVWDPEYLKECNDQGVLDFLVTLARKVAS